MWVNTSSALKKNNQLQCILNFFYHCYTGFISVKSWNEIVEVSLLVEETGVCRENHWPVASHWQALSRIVESSTPHPSGIQTHNFSGDRYLIAKVVVNPTTIWSWPWLPAQKFLHLKIFQLYWKRIAHCNTGLTLFNDKLISNLCRVHHQIEYIIVIEGISKRSLTFRLYIIYTKHIFY